MTIKIALGGSSGYEGSKHCSKKQQSASVCYNIFFCNDCLIYLDIVGYTVYFAKTNNCETKEIVFLKLAFTFIP